MDVKTMREKAIAFVTKSGGQADRSAIKAHLGIEQFAYSATFDQAMKTKRLTPVRGDGVIGKLGAQTLVLGTKPIIAYRLAA